MKLKRPDADISQPIEIIKLTDIEYFVPEYQRGYRWEEQQITDLLNDINDFDEENNAFYCLQPIVLKENEKEQKWNLIDGLHRLTCIFLIIQYINEFFEGRTKKPLPLISYETRGSCATFLKNIRISEDYTTVESSDENGKTIDINSNIDYKHMARVYFAIHKWFTQKGEDRDFSSNKFTDKFLHKTKLIWYELPENEREIDSFTRLNIGKIPLTNAELIKALFLNESNFKSENTSENEIRLIQQTIALEWNAIETMLQNDQFWLFIHKNDFSSSNRIDFILDLIQINDHLRLFSLDANEEEKTKELGSDGLVSFRYFSKLFSTISGEDKKDSLRKSWEKVKEYYQILLEWYEDNTYFHYIGYLVAVSDDKILRNSEFVANLITQWSEKSKTKNEFLNFLTIEIKKKIKNCNQLDAEYDTPGHPSKRQVVPLLLLHNVIWVMNQNDITKANSKYEIAPYSKFPFHLYKKETWDVEHIDSNKGNDLTELKDQQEWIATSFEELPEALKEKYYGEVKDFLLTKPSDEKHNENFSKLNRKLISELSLDFTLSLDEHTKNTIGNFALLDSKTNRGYKNSIFSAKRRWIIGKDQGKMFSYEYNEKYNAGYKVTENETDNAFVPPCTKNAFLKYYTSGANQLFAWNQIDSENYIFNIKSLLDRFLN